MLNVLGAIETGMGVVEKFIAGESQEERLDKELKSQKVAEVAKTRRALIRKSTSRLRFFALFILTAPFIAPLLPWVSVGDVKLYFDQAIAAVPEWWSASLQAAFAAIWAGAETRNLNAGRDERRLAEKESESSTSEPTNGDRQDRQDRPGPPR